MWPGGVQPETAAPYIVPRRATESPARPAAIPLEAPMEVAIYVPTQGASVGYTIEEGAGERADGAASGKKSGAAGNESAAAGNEGAPVRWRLYDGPIRITAPATIRAKAIRYGYKESAETVVRIGG